jgi:energy-coupling factor transporter ATP-binding protein EcfA2
MADERLKDIVLARADADASLSEQVRLVILAALGKPEDLAEALGGAGGDKSGDASPQCSETVAEPIGAYLESITVRGFRGIGAKLTLPLQSGAGLTVIAGRNGSGKSTLAEALELALTGRNFRWDHKKGQVWSQAWRNLHNGDPAEIRIGITEEGSGVTTIGVDWPAGDVQVDAMNVWVQRAGKRRQSIETLGWEAALEMYRPLLSYDELGHILEGTPSQFYDQLHRLLGLEQLSEAMERLDAEVKQLKRPGAELKAVRDALKPMLEDHPDPRAAAALAHVKKTKPDPGPVRPLIGEATAQTTPPAWQQAERLSVPPAEDVALTLTALREAAASEQEEALNSDALAADRARLLEQGLDFHAQHGDQNCPVCGQGTLNEQWALAARAALERELTAASALSAARAATTQARSAVVALVRGVPRPPRSDEELTALDSAQQAWERFTALPVDDDASLADHVDATLPELERTYAALREQAAALIRQRADQWAPIAVQLADWVGKAGAAAQAEPRLKLATDALKWLQENAGELRNERLEPLADRAKRIWAELRQESNVDLGAIRLEGQKTTRRVALRAAVDGAETEAFGVMSQGELQALALAIFIPRATSPGSPFRFLVLDDPIQAMDPSKIDGFLQVLTELAGDRQVIVLSHDDRLPAAIRVSRTKARVLEVTRGSNSTVHVTESSDPATRLLDDAFAIAADQAVPDDIKRRAVPGLCREAVEVTAKDVFTARALAQGRERSEVEAAWEAAQKVAGRVALALSLDAEDNAAVDRWTAGGPARRATMSVVNKGVHQGVFNYKGAVNDARRAIADLAAVAR